MSDLFDGMEGFRRKRDGKEAVSLHNRAWLDWMRGEAWAIARERGTVTSDDLQRICDAHNRYPAHPNAMGAVFHSEEWTQTGWTTSRRPSAHARTIRVWKIKEKR